MVTLLDAAALHFAADAHPRTAQHALAEERDLATIPPPADYLFFGPIFSREMDKLVTGMRRTYVSTSAATFNMMTTADFKRYKAIVFPDLFCAGIGAVSGAMSSRAAWSAAVDGNVIVLGASETWHWVQGGSTLAETGLRFAAAAEGKTGLYFSLSCYYQGAPPSAVAILDQLGSFQAAGAPACLNDAHIVATLPSPTSITAATLSNWGCSVREVLPSFPLEYTPLVVAGASPGLPYVVVKGEGVSLISCGDGVVQPPWEECDDSNLVNGDGCSSTCELECRGTTYWVWNPTNATHDATPRGQLLNNSASCIAVPYTIEARPCAPPATVPVTLKLFSAARTIKTQREDVAPYFLWGDTPATGKVSKNTVPLVPGSYWLHVTMDGDVEKLAFTQTC
jgi:cysteine-rich repeat protein